MLNNKNHKTSPMNIECKKQTQKRICKKKSGKKEKYITKTEHEIKQLKGNKNLQTKYNTKKFTALIAAE